MTEKISIVKTRDNQLEFDINITGAQKKDPVVRLIIENGKVHYTFDCSNLKGEKWVCNIPPLPQLTKNTYPFRLEVIIDGYFFEPYRKSMNIIPEPVVKSGKVAEKHPEKPAVKDKEETKVAPPKKKAVEKRTEAKTTVTKEDAYIPAQPTQPTQPTPAQPTIEEPQDDFANMAAAWMNREKPVLSEKDKKVKNVIQDSLKPKPEPVVVETPVEVPVAKPIEPTEEDIAKLKEIKIKAILNSTKN